LRKPEDVVKVGDKVKALIMSIDKDDKKIALSLKAAAGGDYKNVKQDEVKSATLGDKFKGLFDNE
jgi:small subunit ribosomal protein S1